jgi:hypothetical protein
MPVEVTTYITALSKSEGSASPHYLIELDEGHDRPVWQWLEPEGRNLVPSDVDHILFDGLRIMAQKVSGKPAQTAAEINAALADWIISVTAKGSSIAPKLFDSLTEQGIYLTINLVKA